MSYLVLKSCIANGKRVSAGDIIDNVDIGDAEVRVLLAMGRIERSVAQAEVSGRSNRSVGLTASDAPAPKKRGRKAKNEG